jgi:hypothetical protein
MRPVLFAVFGIPVQSYGVSKVLAAVVGAWLLEVTVDLTLVPCRHDGVDVGKVFVQRRARSRLAWRSPADLQARAAVPNSQTPTPCCHQPAIQGPARCVLPTVATPPTTARSAALRVYHALSRERVGR